LTDEGNILRMRLQGNVLVFIASARGETDQNFEASVSRIKNAIEHGNLTEIKVERAIAEVEDLIMPIIRGLPASKRLEIDGTEFVKVTHLLSGNHAAAIPIESVESLFNDLANYARSCKLCQWFSCGLAQTRPGNAGRIESRCFAGGYAPRWFQNCFLVAASSVKRAPYWPQ